MQPILEPLVFFCVAGYAEVQVFEFPGPQTQVKPKWPLAQGRGLLAQNQESPRAFEFPKTIPSSLGSLSATSGHLSFPQAHWWDV